MREHGLQRRLGRTPSSRGRSWRWFLPALTGVSAVATGIAVYVDGKDVGVSLAWKF